MNRFLPFSTDELSILINLLRTRHGGTQRKLFDEAFQEHGLREEPNTLTPEPIVIGIKGIDAPPVR